MTIAVSTSPGRPLSCPVCNERVDVTSPHVVIAGAAVRVFCSAACLHARDAEPAELTAIASASPLRRTPWWLAGAIVVGATCLALAYVRDPDAGEAIEIPSAAAVLAGPPEPPSPTPATDEIDPRRAADDALIAALMKDAWIHPLAGPVRRMPGGHSGAFGAARPGDRPPECVSGHCGVDLGRTWGEPVHAVHGGVIEFVNRGPNEARGGTFVKIAHRGGQLYSWYFHLAAVPREIRAGTKVTAGQVIGLLGDTGIKHSAPHLHFSISVKPSKHARERYIDPEPLIAIWPLWIPDQNRTSGRLSTREAPGLPVRGSGRRRKPKRRKPSMSAPVAAKPDVASSGSLTPEAELTPASIDRAEISARFLGLDRGGAELEPPPGPKPTGPTTNNRSAAPSAR